MQLEVNNIELTSLKSKLIFGGVAILIISLLLMLVTGVVLSVTAIALFILVLASIIAMIAYPFGKKRLS